MKRSWVGIAIGGTVALALCVIVLRAGRQPGKEAEEAVPERHVETSEHGQPSTRVQQRLQQLREAHARSQQGARGSGQIEARSGVAAKPERPVHGGAPSMGMGGNQAAVADDSGEPEEDPEDFPTLKKTALEDPDPERRLAAVSVLGASEDPEAIPVLAQALSDQDEEVRLAAIQSLADFAGDAPVDALETVIQNDPSADNRYEALEVLSDIGGDRARTAIEKALNDSDEDVKSLAEGILDLEETYEPTPAAEQETPAANP